MVEDKQRSVDFDRDTSIVIINSDRKSVFGRQPGKVLAIENK